MVHQRTPTPAISDMTVETAAATLAQAFEGTAVFDAALPSRERQRAALPGLFAALLRTCRRTGQVLHLDGGAAIAAWHPGDHVDASAFELVRSGLVLAPLYLGPIASVRLQRHDARVHRVLRPAITPGTAYLALVGVRPATQGTGAGRRVVEAALSSMRDAGYERCVLATDDEPNVGLYTHLGFEVVDQLDHPATGLRSWIMARPTGLPVR